MKKKTQTTNTLCQMYSCAVSAPISFAICALLNTGLVENGRVTVVILVITTDRGRRNEREGDE